VPDPDYQYPQGRWYTQSAWGREYMRSDYPENQDLMKEYFRPLARWTDAIQNDFAARADWCVLSFEQANHPPVARLTHADDVSVPPGSTVYLSAGDSSDPDGDSLTCQWWFYQEAGSCTGIPEIDNAHALDASLKIPENAGAGETIHMICEVTDTGSPPLTRYRRVILKVIP
jgi:hypothetical protein